MAKIGEILVQRGLINQEQLNMAMHESKEKSEVIGKTLVRLKLISQGYHPVFMHQRASILHRPQLSRHRTDQA